MRLVKRLLKILLGLVGLLLVLFTVLVLLPERETVPALQPRASTQYWRMSHGFKIAYTHLQGPAGVPQAPIVFLHGGPGGFVHSSSIGVFEKLAQSGHDVYLYDQAGSGLSDRLPRYSDISFRTHLRDLNEIITEQIRAEKVILIGQSFGSILAAHFSAYHPELVERIIFTSPGQLQPEASDPPDSVGLSERYPTPDSLEYLAPYDFVGDVNRAAMTPKAVVATTGALLFDRKFISDEQMDRMLNRLMSKIGRAAFCDTGDTPPEEGGMGLYAYIGTNNYSELPDVRDQIRQLDLAVLVIQGQCDFIPYSCAYEYVDLYRQSRFVFIEDSGHLIWWEQPEKFVETIMAFLSES